MKYWNFNEHVKIPQITKFWAKCTFRILGGKPCPLGVAWQLWKNGNFGRVGDKNMFKMYKKAGVGREGDIW